MPQPYEQPRFVAFVDVLGYKAIVRGAAFNDTQRFHYLHSVFSSLAVAAHDIAHDFSQEIAVRAVQFSDSFYFSSESAITLVTAIAHYFANVLTFYDHAFSTPRPEGATTFPEWLPFLRGGIVHGWMFEGHDITLPQLQNPADSFRNPIGPAVASAYLLSEKTDLEGMRLATTRAVRDRFLEELPSIRSGSQIAQLAPPLLPLFLKTHADFGEIFEVPWFEARLLTDNTIGTFDTLVTAQRQFAPAVMKHFRGTWDAVLRTPSLERRPQLRDRAANIRFNVVQRMAYAHWVKRGRPEGSPQHDWLVAEGIIPSVNSGEPH